MTESRQIDDFSEKQHRKKNPDLWNILNRLSEEDGFPQSRKDKFVTGDIRDILLPFPKDGMGLPSGIEEAAAYRFFRAQKNIQTDHELEKVFQDTAGSAPRHLRLSDDTVEHELEVEFRGEGGYAGVSAVNHRNIPKPKRPVFALKRMNRPTPATWSHIRSIGQQGATYPDRRQILFETEVEFLGRLRKDRTDSADGWENVLEAHFVRLCATFTSPSAFFLLLQPVAICNFEELLSYYAKDQGPELQPSEGTLQRLQELGESELAGFLYESFGCLAASLVYMHHIAKIRHQDIKPQNILLVYEDGKGAKCCLCDFATACRTNSTALPLVQTDFYLSPERLDKSPNASVGTEDDMYTLGLVMFEVIAALKRQPRTELHKLGQLRPSGSAGPDGTIPFLDRCWTERELEEWGRSWTEKQPETINPAWEWVRGLLCRNPKKRMTSGALSKAISEHSSDHRFWGHCCDWLYANAGLESLLGLKKGEKIVAQGVISEATWRQWPGRPTWESSPPIEAAEREVKVNESSTAVIVEAVDTSSTERRLHVVKNSEWIWLNKDDGFSRGMWLPVTGLQMEETRDSNKISIRWSHYNHRVRVPTDYRINHSYWLGSDANHPNRQLDLVFAAESDAKLFISKFRGIFDESLAGPDMQRFITSKTEEFCFRKLDSQTFPCVEGIRLARGAPEKTIVQPKGALFKGMQLGTSWRHDLFLISENRPLRTTDVKYNHERPLQFTVSGLWSLCYRSTGVFSGRCPEEKESREPVTLFYTERTTEPPLAITVPRVEVGGLEGDQTVLLDLGEHNSPQTKSLLDLLESLIGWRMHLMCVGHLEKYYGIAGTSKGMGVVMLWKRGNEWQLTFTPKAKTGNVCLLGKVPNGKRWPLRKCEESKKTCTIDLCVPTDESATDTWKSSSTTFEIKMNIANESIWKELNNLAVAREQMSNIK